MSKLDDLVYRKEYINWLNSFADQKLIKVLSGIRRAGKSTILKLYSEELLKKVNPKNIQSYNFEELETQNIGDYLDINNLIVKNLVKNEMNYIFLDEIQNVNNFEKLVDSLYVKDNIDLYITGSNAYFLSGEWATLLTGRYVEKTVYPYSYQEYLLAINPQKLTNSDTFTDYLNKGGIPEYVNLLNRKNPNAEQFVENLFNSIIEKDIYTRVNIKNKHTFQKIINFVLDTLGSEVSANSISNFLLSEKIKIDNETVSNYLNLLVESKLFEKVNRYDIKGKSLLKTLEKYYVVDTAFRTVKLNKQQVDVGHLLENAVYFELKRNFKTVNIGKFLDKEVDFVVTDYQGYVSYYQVSYSTLEKATLERELAPLKAIKDSNPKFLLTADADVDPVYDGIRKYNVEKWLRGVYE